VKGNKLKRKTHHASESRHGRDLPHGLASDGVAVPISAGDAVIRTQPEQAAHVQGNSAAAISSLATHWWRAMSKAQAMAAQGGSGSDAVRLLRYLTAMGDSLTTLGILVTDPVNEPYDAGMGLKVTTFETHNGTGRDIISETLRPQVTWGHQLIQLAEVIVTTFAVPTPREGQHGQDNN
jgi:hypothetical protein